MDWPNLDPILAPIPYAVVGAVAARLYMPERSTLDLDVLVTTVNFARTEERLGAAGWQRLGDLTIGGSSWRAPDGALLDVLHTSAPWAAAALAEAQGNRDEQGLPIISLPYLVLMKLNASRTTDIGDLARMLGLADADALERVRAAVAAFAPEDLDDLDALVELGRLETQEPG